jgi:hypothetical protein
MARQSYQWNAGTITIQPPAGAPNGCPPCELVIGTVTVSWGQDIEPNWPGFRLAMMQSAAFLRIANASAPLFVMLNSVMWLIATDPTKLQETALIWNQLATIAQPTEAEITALNAIAATNQIPLQLNESGMIE